MVAWARDAFFYHIYPLGLCGAPPANDFTSPPQPRLEQLHGWIEHLRGLGVTAVYLGPVFESTSHGYDTADYYHVDRRLGTNETLANLSAALHHGGIRLVLDGVFHHVGRDFWAFRDLLARGEGSPYRDWFAGVRFDGRSPRGDPFTYDGWNGHYNLAKLNVHNPAVKEHLFQAVRTWIENFGIDGLRLDVADSLDLQFQQELAAFCRQVRGDFWLMGEVIHGDYRRWANPTTLNAVTNYELYKGLYSSHNDRNYFEVAATLNRQYASYGLYRDLALYNFADNHDVDRVATRLRNPAHLYPLYALLFTVPGVPSLYYGSEWGIAGRKAGDDRGLRPPLDLASAARTGPHPDLARAIARFARLRHGSRALRHGDYQQIHVAAEQLVFARQAGEECVVVAVNAASSEAAVDVVVPKRGANRAVDLLNEGEEFRVENGRLRLDPLYPCWARVLALA